MPPNNIRPETVAGIVPPQLSFSRLLFTAPIHKQAQGEAENETAHK